MEQATGYAPALRRGEDEQAGLSRGTELGASFRGARAAGRSPEASRGRLAGARLEEAGFPALLQALEVGPALEDLERAVPAFTRTAIE